MIDDARFTRETEAMLDGLYRLSMSILHAQADAQDAVQQGVLRAWERRAQAREESFRGWLTRIVINECRNIQRGRMRVFPVERLPERAQPEADGERAALMQAVDAMPEKLRMPLLLLYMEEYTEREIASSLGIPVTTVKNRLYRARQLLKKQLGCSEVTFE